MTWLFRRIVLPIAGCLMVVLMCGCSTPQSELVYNPVVVEVGQGLEITTPPPEIGKRVREISAFSLESPVIQGIDIDPDTGAITVSGSARLGVYRLDVGATDRDGTSVFKDAVVVFVLPALPTTESVTYTQSPLSVVTGLSFISDPPAINDLAGTLQFTFAGTGESWLSIDERSGAIQVEESAAPGTYEIPVTVTNEVGEVTINDALVLEVRAFVTFNDDIKPLVLRRCTPCHTFGTGTENLTIYETAAKKPDKIITRINLPTSDQRFMPPGGQRLPAVELSLFERWNDEGLLRE